MRSDLLIQEIKDKLFEFSPLAILVFDPNMELIFANGKVSDWTDYSNSELLGKKLFNLPFIPLEAQKIAKTNFSQRLAGNEIPAYDFPIISKKGKTLIGSINGSVIRGEANEILGVLIMVSNVTEKAKLKNLYEALVRASPDAVTATDLNGIITLASDESARLHGVKSPKDLVGKNAFDLIVAHDRPRALINMKKTLEQGVVRDIEYKMVRVDGSSFIGELSASVIRDEKGEATGFIATVHDVTKRKESEEALKTKTEELEKLNRLMIGRELRMKELKEEMEKLKQK